MTERARHWSGLVQTWSQSGLSQAEFCRRREVGYSTMAAWRRSVRRGTAAFVEVEALERVTPPAGRSTGSLCAELMLPGGAVLRVYQIKPMKPAAARPAEKAKPAASPRPAAAPAMSSRRNSAKPSTPTTEVPNRR